MGCLWRLFLLVLLAAVVIALLVLLLPHLIAQAGNSLLNNINSSGSPLSGLVQYIPANFLDKNNKLQISLNGLTPNKQYEITLDPQTCGSSGYVDVGIVTADESGNVTNTFSLSASALHNTNGWQVDVHNGAAVGDATLACGQLNDNGSSVAVEATNTVLQLSPVATQSDSTQFTPGVKTNTPSGFPNTGVAPGSNNSYDNAVYPRKF